MWRTESPICSAVKSPRGCGDDCDCKSELLGEVIRLCIDVSRPSIVPKKMMRFNDGLMPAATSFALRLVYNILILKGKNIMEKREPM